MLEPPRDAAACLISLHVAGIHDTAPSARWLRLVTLLPLPLVVVQGAESSRGLSGNSASEAECVESDIVTFRVTSPGELVVEAGWRPRLKRLTR